MNRDQIIALIVAKAQADVLVPWEFLGGAIAESELNPAAWRQGAWPDWSAGLFQQTVRYADEGDQTSSPENVALIKLLYFDPVHACDVAAGKFKAYRTHEATALDAWCRYNWPAREPALNPNRANYARGLAEAQDILGGQSMTDVAALQQKLIALGKSQTGKPYSGPIVGQPESYRWGDPGYDCSSFVSWLYSQVTGGQIKLTAFTDAAYGQCSWQATPQPGDIVFYHYPDSSQPGVTYPHMGIWLSPTEVLDCRYPEGVGIHPHVTPVTDGARYRKTMRPIGLESVVVTDPTPAPSDELATLRAQNDALRTQLADANSKLGFAAVDIANAIEAAISTLRGLKPA